MEVTTDAVTADLSYPSMQDPDWAVTMFSFTNELVSSTGTPIELMSSVAEAGLGRRVELDAPQHFHTYPRIDQAEIDQTLAAADEHAITFTMLGVYNDQALHWPKLFTVEESAAYLEPQIEAAARLGCFGVRIMFGIDPALSERLVPIAERHSVRVLQEVQGGVTPDGAEFGRQKETLERIGSDRLGFVFDLSACMPRLPISYLDALRREGVPGSAVDYLDWAWQGEPLPSIRSRLDDLVRDAGLTPAAHLRLSMPFSRFGRSTVSEWRGVLGDFAAIHLKYWDLDDADGRVSEPVADVQREFAALDYRGVVTSEWGGHEWCDLGEPGAVEMTRAHRAMYDAVLP